MSEAYSLDRYFGTNIPKDVKPELHLEGIRPLKAGSKFKVKGERGDYIFLYCKGKSVTCFDPNGRFYTVGIDRITRAINRSRREIAKESA